MNKRQYDIVKTVIAMGNEASKVAKTFDADPLDVQLAASTSTYKQYKTLKGKDTFGKLSDLFGFGL